jgi:hypothetical protein
VVLRRRAAEVVGGPGEAGNWKLEAGSWKLEAGSWELETGKWELGAGGWRLAAIYGLQSPNPLIPAHGVWIAGHIPGARRRLLAPEGDLSMAAGAPDPMLDDSLAP